MSAPMQAAPPSAQATTDWSALDWRFLLPNPSLAARTACIDVPEHIRTAVGAAGAKIVVLDGVSAERESKSFDLVICFSRRLNVPSAVHLLRPDGAAMVRVPRWNVSPTWMRSHCDRVGGRMLGMYLHYPNIVRSRYILPLHDRKAAAFALRTLAGPRVQAFSPAAPVFLALAQMFGTAEATVVVQPAS